MEEKKIPLSSKNLVDFLSIALTECGIQTDIKSAFKLANLIHECYEDSTMFDSWFLGIDVMN